MNDTRKKLWQEINDRMAKHKKAKARALHNRTIESFVLAFIKNIEDINTFAPSGIEWSINAQHALHSLEMHILVFDKGVRISPSWYFEEEGKAPLVNGVTIKWSEAYQKENNCDPELFLDATELLFN